MRNPGKFEARIVVAVSVMVLGFLGLFSDRALEKLKELINQ